MKLLGRGKGGCGSGTYRCELWNGDGGGGGAGFGGTYRCEQWNSDEGGEGGGYGGKNEGGVGDKLLLLLIFSLHYSSLLVVMWMRSLGQF